MFAVPITVSYRGKSTHRQWVGGLMTILVISSVLAYFSSRLRLLLNHQRDEYMMSGFFTDYKDREPYKLKGGDLDFKVAIMDKTFNLDDNPYGEIKLHRYTNYEAGGGATTDSLVDLVDCNYADETNEEKNDLWNMKQKYLCPKFSESDILYGDYYSTKSSWLRLVVHKCDEKKRKK